MTGTVLALDEASLTIALDDRVPVRFPIVEVSRLEASAGTRRHRMKGLVYGAVGMGLLGATWSIDPDDCGTDSENFCSRAEAIGSAALLGGLVGALVGASMETDLWIPVAVRPGSAEAGVALRF